MYRFIYLAAGYSSRFGENKLLAAYRGRPMFSCLLTELLKVCASRALEADVTVVTQYGEILDWCREREEGRSGLLQTVVNPDPARGIASSLRCGIEAAVEKKPLMPEDRLVCFVADQPSLRGASVVAFLESAGKAGAVLACCGRADGSLGNPCLFAPGYVPELMALEGDRGGKRVIMRHREEVFIFRGVPEEELSDIDTLQKMEEAERRAASLENM